jgi:hypothetical protein
MLRQRTPGITPQIAYPAFRGRRTSGPPVPPPGPIVICETLTKVFTLTEDLGGNSCR